MLLDQSLYGYNVTMTADRLTVNGQSRKLVYDPSYVYKVQKTQIKTNNPEDFARVLTDSFYSCLVTKVLASIAN